MLTVKITAALVPAATRALARVIDRTDWTQAVTPRGTWALFLAGVQLGSTQAQDQELVPISYDPHVFLSGSNLTGIVDVPLPSDGVFRLQAVAVPVLLSAAELALATSGRAYWQLDSQQFVYKTAAGAGQKITTWNDILDAARTDHGSGLDTQNLLDKSAQAFTFNDADLRAGLAKLNLRYLEAPNRLRTALQYEYSQAELLVTGAKRQFDLGLFADAATSLLAAQRLLGACLPGFAQSLPALLQPDCGCH